MLVTKQAQKLTQQLAGPGDTCTDHTCCWVLYLQKYFHGKLKIFFGYNEGFPYFELPKLTGYYAPISPASPFAQCWELANGLFLLYSIFVTPLLIAFFTIEAGFCGLAPTGYTLPKRYLFKPIKVVDS